MIEDPEVSSLQSSTPSRSRRTGGRRRHGRGADRGGSRGPRHDSRHLAGHAPGGSAGCTDRGGADPRSLDRPAPPHDEPTVPEAERRSRRSIHRLRTRPWRTAGIALAMVLIAGAIPVLGAFAGKTIIDSREGRLVERVGRTADVVLPPTPTQIIVGLDAEGQAETIAIASLRPGGRGGFFILMPTLLRVEVPGIGPAPLASVFATGGATLLRQTVETSARHPRRAGQCARHDVVADRRQRPDRGVVRRSRRDPRCRRAARGAVPGRPELVDCRRHPIGARGAALPPRRRRPGSCATRSCGRASSRRSGTPLRPRRPHHPRRPPAWIRWSR